MRGLSRIVGPSFVTAMAVQVGVLQVQRVGLVDDYYSYQGKFSITPHRVFSVVPVEERGKDTNLLVKFLEERKKPVSTITCMISMFNNPKNQTLKEWADSGRRSWVTEPAYKEEKYEEVDWMGSKAWVHTFTFQIADFEGYRRDKFKMKSIRYMRKGIGYWFVFYSTPIFFEDYVRAWDGMLKTIKFDDEMKDTDKKDGRR